MQKQALEAAKRSMAVERETIANTMDNLDEKALMDAADILCTCGKIITSGCGSSGIAAKKFAHTLCCIEKDGYFLSPAEALHGGLGCIKQGDVLVLVSRGGKTAELLPMIKAVREKRARLIVITENINSPLAQAADVVMPLHVEREADPQNVMATASFVATIAIFDAWVAAIMEETGYQLKQFALIHPGGAVGERLNT